MAIRATPKPLTLAEMHDAAGLGPEWNVIWTGADPVAEREHYCGSLTAPEGTARGDWVRIRYAPTGTRGVQAAKCVRCQTAWVRVV